VKSRCLEGPSAPREAEELHRAALASKESQLGPKHRSTIASFFYLADLLEAKGAFIEVPWTMMGHDGPWVKGWIKHW
jgi:hypothetical protein